jgi:hypothetical protein
VGRIKLLLHAEIGMVYLSPFNFNNELRKKFDEYFHYYSNDIISLEIKCQSLVECRALAVESFLT